MFPCIQWPTLPHKESTKYPLNRFFRSTNLGSVVIKIPVPARNETLVIQLSWLTLFTSVVNKKKINGLSLFTAF
jgi:hypothetical protein